MIVIGVGLFWRHRRDGVEPPPPAFSELEPTSLSDCIYALSPSELPKMVKQNGHKRWRHWLAAYRLGPLESCNSDFNILLRNSEG